MIQVFIYDETLNILDGKKVIEKKFKGIIENGRIIDKAGFMESFLKVLKEKKVKTKFFGDNITMIKNTYYQISDINYLENIFLEIGFLKVIFYDIRKLFLDKKTFIEINDTYMIINLDNGIYLDLKYFKDIPKILDYFSDYITEDVYLFGCNKLIPKIKIKGKDVYYYEDCKNFIIDSLPKVNKCDV